MRGCRHCIVLLVVSQGALIAATTSDLFAQAAAGIASNAIKPPDQLLIPLTKGKAESRPIPGLEDAGYQYRYDPAGLMVGRLKQFQIERKVRHPSQRNLDFEWRTTANVEDGDLYPFLGQVYRWSGKTTTLVLVPEHPLAPVEPDPDAQISVFWKLYLKNPSSAVSRVNFEIKEFEGDTGAGGRVKVEITLDSTQKLKLPDKSVGKFLETISMKAGDRVGSLDWEITLKRVVSPVLQDRNPGWVEFVVVPLDRLKK